MTVNKATPKITWAKPAAITYGTPLSPTQLNATATDVNGKSMSGTFNYNPPATVVPIAGTTPLSVSFVPDDTNYLPAPKLNSITVNKATSTTVITSNPATMPGIAVTVGFSVTGPGPLTPTGTVTVKATSGESCSGPLTAGAGSCPLTFKTTVQRTLTATYAGDSNFLTSSSVPVPQIVK